MLSVPDTISCRQRRRWQLFVLSFPGWGWRKCINGDGQASMWKRHSFLSFHCRRLLPRLQSTESLANCLQIPPVFLTTVRLINLLQFWHKTFTHTRQMGSTDSLSVRFFIPYMQHESGAEKFNIFHAIKLCAFAFRPCSLARSLVVWRQTCLSWV